MPVANTRSRWGYTIASLVISPRDTSQRARRTSFTVSLLKPGVKVTSSQRAAVEQLKLDALTIVCPGSADYPLDEKIQVSGLSRFTVSE